MKNEVEKTHSKAPLYIFIGIVGLLVLAAFYYYLQGLNNKLDELDTRLTNQSTTLRQSEDNISSLDGRVDTVESDVADLRLDR